MLAYEARQLANLASRLGIPVGSERWVNAVGESGDLPREPVHAPPRRLRSPWQPPRVRVLPRAARNGGLPGVRRLLPQARTQRHAEIDRRPGDQRGDGGGRARDGDRRGEGAPDPDRRRPRRVPLANRRREGARPPGARVARLGVRRRLVPEGRGRLGRGTGAKAHQGPRRARRGGRAAPRASCPTCGSC